MQEEHNMQGEDVVDESRGPYFPFNRKETYPPRLKVDFRRLPTTTLLQYTGHHDLHIRPDSSHEELAIAAARHFAGWHIDEEAIMRSFCAGLASSTLGSRRGLGDDETEADRSKRLKLDSLDGLNVVPPSPDCWGGGGGGGRGSGGVSTVGYGGYGGNGGFGGDGGGSNGGDNCAHGYRDLGRNYASSSSTSSTPPRSMNHHYDRVGGGNGGGGGISGGALGILAEGARYRKPVGPEFDTGEQVAAHVVQRKTGGGEEEAEPPLRAWILARVVSSLGDSKQVQLHDEDDPAHVFELPERDVLHLEDFSPDLRKHDKVLAVFPDTTIFYRATVAKDKPRMDGNSKVVVVCFEDDEDMNGRYQFRNIPVAHVLPEGHVRHGGPGGGRSSGGGGRANRGAKAGVPRRASGGPRSRSTSPRVRGEYGGGGGGTAGNFPQGGSSSMVSRVSGGGSASGAGAARASSGNRAPQEPGQSSKKGGATYADMIAHALDQLEGGKGGFLQICDIIEKQFAPYLNWKLESDVRKTPVWKSSVRKICFSNTRFQHVITTPELGHVFTLARSKKN